MTTKQSPREKIADEVLSVGVPFDLGRPVRSRRGSPALVALLVGFFATGVGVAFAADRVLERFEEATPVLAQNDAEVEGSVVAPHHSDEKVIPPAQESVDDETESAVPVAVHAPITETAPLPRRAAQPVSPPVVATAAEVHPAERWDTGAHDGDATDDSLDALLDRALGGAPRAPVVTATESLPDTPTRQQVLTTLRALEGEIRECAEGANGVVQTRLVVNGSTGRVSDVSVGGVVAGTPAARCATDILESARFPRFARERFEISFPYSV